VRLRARAELRKLSVACLIATGRWPPVDSAGKQESSEDACIGHLSVTHRRCSAYDRLSLRTEVVRHC
jgi:hypothetical protein